MPRQEPLIVKCPQCRREVPWRKDNPWRPFCSQRCKQLDLGAWASESYRVPVQSPDPQDDFEGN